MSILPKWATTAQIDAAEQAEREQAERARQRREKAEHVAKLKQAADAAALEFNRLVERYNLTKNQIETLRGEETTLARICKNLDGRRLTDKNIEGEFAKSAARFTEIQNEIRRLEQIIAPLPAEIEKARLPYNTADANWRHSLGL